MKNIWNLSFFVFYLLLGACTTNTESTPTPFPIASTLLPGTGNVSLVAVDIAELVTHPELYEGSMVMVNGRYQSTISHVCSTTLYDSPSTWGLTANEWIAYMSGFDNQLRSLLPEETSMTVTGIWRQWRGPVGCGKDAVVQDIWYLDVKKINSPNPLTHITLTPTIPGGETEIADEGGLPNENDPGQQVPTSPSNSEEATPTNSPINLGEPESTPFAIGTPATTPSNPGGSSTATTAPSPTATTLSGGGGNGTDPRETAVPTNTPIPTTTPGQGSITATPTSSSGSGGSQNTPQPTPNPLSTSTPSPNLSTVSKGEILSLEVEHESIGVQEIHEWTFELFADETFTVTVAGGTNVNIVLSILDANDNTIIDQQNIASSENLEVAVVNKAEAGTYLILVETVNHTAGYYAIAAVEADSLASLPTAYKSILADGDSKRTTVAVDFEDYWFFYAESGDVVTISVEPFDNNADMYLALFHDDVDPNGPIIEVDSPTLGATEELVNYTIPQTGVYMVVTSEFDFNEVEYEISLSIN